MNETFKSLFPLTDISNILEIGCSFGETTRELTHLFPEAQITAVDTHSYLIKRNSCTGNVVFLNEDGYYPERFCEKESQDLVLVMNNLGMDMEMGEDFIGSTLTRISDITSPGGRVLISSNTSYFALKKEEKG